MRDARNWIQTASGRQFWPLDPQPEDVCIEDIAHALSNLARFTGHTRIFYSVGEHCERASRAIDGLPEARSLPLERVHVLAQAALLHDACEAYLIDVPAPIKPHLVGYGEIEARLQRVIEAAFRLPTGVFDEPLVKQVDLVMLATEKRDLMGPSPAPWASLPEPLLAEIYPRTPVYAEQYFMTRYKELFT